MLKFKHDKIIATPEIKPTAKTKENINIFQFLMGKRGIFYTDFIKNKTYNDKTFQGKNIVIEYNIPDLKWNITNETQNYQWL